MTATATPALTVIIPSVNGAILFECLSALGAASPSVGGSLELIVIERCGAHLRRQLADLHPEVIVLPVDAGMTIPEMRALGFRQARGAAVAVIEDHVIVPPDWPRRMLDALAEGADVVGGSVQNAATGTTVDWAAFLCEYSHMLAPVGGERVDGVTGNNVVYRGALVKHYVGHKMHYRIRDYVGQRYLYSRAYAGMRRSAMPAAGRAVHTLAAFALPPLLLARIVGRVRASGRHQDELVRSLPLLLLFVCSWAAGEAVGYAVGPGNALARVK